MRALTNKKELSRFVVGGTSAVITDYLTYRLMAYAGLDVSAAKLISFILGSFVGFTINKYWTFESTGKIQKELAKYTLLYTVTAGLNVAVNHVALGQGLPVWLAFLFATGASTVANFLGQKFFVFRKAGSF